jgi:hypothetical protein
MLPLLDTVTTGAADRRLVILLVGTTHLKPLVDMQNIEKSRTIVNNYRMKFFIGHALNNVVPIENIQIYLFTKELEFSIFRTRGYK